MSDSKISDQYAIVSPEFDEEYYLRHNSDLLEEKQQNPDFDLIRHYLLHGWKEGRDPSPFFSTQKYLRANHDVRESGENPFWHYLVYGRGEGRDGTPPGMDSYDEVYKTIATDFDTNFYVERYNDLYEAKQRDSSFDAIRHYIEFGWREGRDPSPSFSTTAYLSKNPHVRHSGQVPFYHYLISGRHGQYPVEHAPVKNRSPDPADLVYSAIRREFDPGYYSETYPDIRSAIASITDFDPIRHYIDFGCLEGRDPTAYFSTLDYLRMNPDVRAAGQNPFFHYIEWGRAEGRAPRNAVSRRFPALASAPTILFVGHSGHPAGGEVMLRDIIQWYADSTPYNIDIALLNGGPLVYDYQRFGRTIVLNGAAECSSGDLDYFLRSKYDLVYLNTVVSGAFADALVRKYAPHLPQVVFHIHEMRHALEEFRSELELARPFVSQYIAASEAVGNTLITDFGVSPELIDVRHSFVTISCPTTSDTVSARSMARAKLDLKEDEFVIMGAGTVYPRKGPDLFVDTLSEVMRAAETSQVTSLWLGDGPQLQSMIERVSALGLSDRIRFIGFRADARELLAACDLFLLPSREDPFPLVCLEAASYGAPTLHFEGVTGIGELTRDGGGYRVEPFDTTSMAREILFLLNDRVSLDVAGQLARSRVKRHYERDAAMLRMFVWLRDRFNFSPTTSVVIPNYNHERFLAQRIQSVVSQTMKDTEIIILDDASTDRSVDVISRFTSDPRVHLYCNTERSGSTFKQWQKGVSLARGQSIWIAESDDFCSDNLIESTLYAFRSTDVAISFCKTLIADQNGRVMPSALDDYLKSTKFNKFDKDYVLPAVEEINDALSFRCTIVNASAVLFHADSLRRSVKVADGYQMCGDWRVYLEMLRYGGVSYTTRATNYFRRHGSSVVHALEGSDTYFRERGLIAKFVCETFNCSERARRQIIVDLENEWQRFSAVPKATQSLDGYFDRSSVINMKNVRPRGRIGLYVHGLLFSKGGIERLCALLARYLVRDGHEVIVYCRTWGASPPIYDLGSFVKVRPIFDETAIPSSIKALRSALADDDIDIFIPMLSEWLFEPVLEAASGLGISIIVSEHNDPAVIEERWWSREARVGTFAKAHAIHLLLNRFTSSLPLELRQKTVVIPNCVGHVDSSLLEHDEFMRFVAVGRLVHQKGFDRAIRAMAQVVKLFPRARLEIFGDGADKQKLEELSSSLMLEKSVIFRGVSDDILPEMRRSAALLVPSRFEGFGIVVIEAKAVGLPAIAYSDCNGPNELIRDGVDGLLVAPDESGGTLAQAMQKLLSDRKSLDAMRKSALKDSEAYHSDKVLPMWASLIERILVMNRARH